MIQQKYHTVLITTLLFSLLFSCISSEGEDTFAYFGGHITNPKEDIIVFLKDGETIDTIQLDAKNSFLRKFKNLEEGLYTFKHGIEYQYVYLEPTDSVLVHLNTWDFDENLVFSGRGSEKNEYLINSLLDIERKEKIVEKYYPLNELIFLSKLDSLHLLKVATLSQFKTSVENISPGFMHLAEASTNYPFLRRKEAYTYFYKNAHKLKEFPKVGTHFYDYRATVDLNDTNLISFYPYTNYVTNYIYNAGYTKIATNKECQVLATNMLEVISENINEGDFKNKMLKNVLIRDFLKGNSTCSFSEANLKLFYNHCTNEDFKKEIRTLAKESKLIKNNSPLRSFNLIDKKDTTIAIETIIKNNSTVLYFWSTEFMSPEYLAKRLRYFKQKYPSVLFVGVQTNADFKTTSALKNVDLGLQFKIPTGGIAHSYFSSNFPRSIIINKKGLVTNGFAYFNSKFFAPQMSALIK
ncbi:MAG: hypothetical protein COB60_02230 [Flavobacteriaceae bacterium]|nr:MAG: hypothetical protein COB60_02230 [Flavobacteriaceae bacterium]